MTPDERKKINVILAAFMEPKPTPGPPWGNYFISVGGWWKYYMSGDSEPEPAHDCTTDLNDGMRVVKKLDPRAIRLERILGVWMCWIKINARKESFLEGDDPAEALALACVEVVESLKENGK